MKYFDTHAHYYDERFIEECKEGVSTMLNTLFHSKIKKIINVGTCYSTCISAIKQAKNFSQMYTALGIHPTDGQYVKDLDEELNKVQKLIIAPENKCVAIGEIGLDYHYPDTDKEKQAYLFEAQMLLAERLNLPVVIHDRDAHADVFDMICKHKKVTGILHSYSGSPEMALDLVKRGYYISFSGTLTFKNARKVVECAQVLPKDRVLIETDAPYLAPHPLRGTLNHSGNLIYTNQKLAEIWCVTEEESAKVTAENAERIFRL